jgi:hypothetical protein
VTLPSESKRRSLAAIGNGCVIPAQAGIQCLVSSESKRRSLAAIGNGCVIPAPDRSTRGQAAAGIHEATAAPLTSSRLRAAQTGIQVPPEAAHAQPTRP